MSYKNHYIAFLDILGFKRSFIENKNDDRSKLLALLKKYAERNGNHSDEETNGDIKIKPAILCFSDNIAISLSAEHKKLSQYELLMIILGSVTILANEALALGYFLRGALSYGLFYHEDGVVIGEPLIEAAASEKIANYPRIIMTQSFIAEFEKFAKSDPYSTYKGTYENFYLKKDSDGMTFLDYIDFFHCFNKNESIAGQVNINDTIIKINKDIEECQDLSILQKLNWLRRYLQSKVNR